MFDLRYRNNREEFGEQEITGKEQPEGSHVEIQPPRWWVIISTP